ncbi:type II and III secretion system protein family protein [Sphingosinicella terrae]|jgi:pilus assembly protein CpaC|uniref:type II and III secretion system protein family protein n=1 Tax=Sphingosinicella terrae TaxID=2172047 RepID=UPI000E0DDD3E|nr:type II and III secretion system protein family protein [Sphingosinicella terrae]
MTIKKFRNASLGAALAVALAAVPAAAPFSAFAQSASSVAPSNDITLSVGTGRMVRLNGTMSDIFVANPEIADVQVRSTNQIYVFGKGAGQTTVFATNGRGQVIYSANVRVGQNLASVDDMLSLAMPEADITATPMSGMVLLTGTVAQPDDAAEAERLAQAFVGEGTQVVSRLRTATPQQVMLQVRIAEVSRTLVREAGVNLETFDPTGGSTGFFFGRGPDAFDFESGTFTRPEGTSQAGLLLRNVFGLDVAGSLDLNENNGLVTILAEPTLTALSGETASFLAGGEFPIPIQQSLGTTTIEYRQYGVGLSFTPFVLENGRISMRVRPEVSELTAAGAVEFNGFEVPALSIRRTETTVELGSGQSMVIGGLLRNTGNNSIERTPFLGNLPILGALFRSNNFRRQETELVIVVTPYLVRPVNANQIALPTDGFRNANDAQRLLGNQAHDSRTGEQRPMPTAAPPRTVAPGLDGAAATVPGLPAPMPVEPTQSAALQPQRSSPGAQPGFNF